MNPSEHSEVGEQSVEGKKASSSMKSGEQEAGSSSGASKGPPKRDLYGKLQSAVQTATRRLTSKSKIIPYIKEQFRKGYEVDSKYVLEVFTSMMDQLQSMVQDEIKLQVEESDVEQLLADLDKLMLEQPEILDKIWRPSGNPEEDIRGHLVKPSSEEVHQLEKILASLNYQNDLLNAHAFKVRQTMDHSIQTLIEQHQVWQKAAEASKEDLRKVLIESDAIQNRGIRPLLDHANNDRADDSSMELGQK